MRRVWLRLPEVGDGDAQVVEQVAEEWEREPDDGAVVAFDPLDKRPTKPVDSEGPGDVERLTGGNVGVDLFVAEVGKVDDGGGNATDGNAGKVDQIVPGMQDTGPPPHPLPPLHRIGGIDRLAKDLAIEGKHGVAPEHEQPPPGTDSDPFDTKPPSDGGCLEPSKRKTKLLSANLVNGGLVNTADNDVDVDPGRVQQGPPSRTRRSQYKSCRSTHTHGELGYRPRTIGPPTGTPPKHKGCDKATHNHQCPNHTRQPNPTPTRHLRRGHTIADSSRRNTHGRRSG